MRLKTFSAKNMNEALASVRAEMGPEAIIISSHRGKNGGLFVRAALEESAAEARAESTATELRQEAEKLAHGQPEPPQDFEQTFQDGLARRIRGEAPPTKVKALSFNRGELLKILHTHRTPEGLAHVLAENAEKSRLADMTLALASALDLRMPTAPLFAATQNTLMLAGPHGAGKTAVAAKIAAHARLAGRDVTLIAGDAEGAGAVARLETFANHLNAKIIVADSAEFVGAPYRQRTHGQSHHHHRYGGLRSTRRQGTHCVFRARQNRRRGNRGRGFVHVGCGRNCRNRFRAQDSRRATADRHLRRSCAAFGCTTFSRHARAAACTYYPLAFRGGWARNPHAAFACAAASAIEQPRSREPPMSSLQSDYGFARLTAIGSGKGGTGKTFVSVTLAHALAHLGEKVLLCDADLGLSNSALHLGLDSGGDIAGVLAGKTPLEQAVVPVFGGISARGGFDLLGAPAGSGALANAGELGAGQLLTTLRFAAQYDRVLLDLGRRRGCGCDAVCCWLR